MKGGKARFLTTPRVGRVRTGFYGHQMGENIKGNENFI